MIVFFIILTLLLSAFFSGSEIAFVSASKLKVELGKDKEDDKGKIISRFYEQPAEFIGTLLVGNNIALVVFTILLTGVLEVFFTGIIENDFALLLVNTFIITLIVLVFGEFLPKTIFNHYAERALFFLAKPLNILSYILYIPARIMLRTCDFIITKILRVKHSEAANNLTAFDLQDLVEETAQAPDEVIDTELFQRALDFKNVKVKECMVPRTEIVHIDMNQSIEELEIVIQESRLSRIVVIKNDIDHIIGYVHHGKLLSKPKDIKSAMIGIKYVPETMRVQDLLSQFINNGTNIATVVDEYGSIAGIITMEDILEEIFGEIEDEHDKEGYLEIQISEQEFLLSGRLEVDYLNEKYEALHFPEGDYQSLSGYVVMTTEEIPNQGDVIDLDGYKFILEEVSDTKVEVIRVIKTKFENEELAV